VRAAMQETWRSFTPVEWEQLREGGRLSMQVPEIRARTTDEFSRLINTFAGALAQRAGKCADDVRVRVLAGAIIGVLMSVFLPEHLQQEAGVEFDPSLFGPESTARIDEALALLEAGLPL